MHGSLSMHYRDGTTWLEVRCGFVLEAGRWLYLDGVQP
jgi:uncharacterized protein YchJ